MGARVLVGGVCAGVDVIVCGVVCESWLLCVCSVCVRVLVGSACVGGLVRGVVYVPGSVCVASICIVWLWGGFD